MWQILNTSSKSDPNTEIEPKSASSVLRAQMRQWKYGTITISDRQPNQFIGSSPTQLLLTTHPFQEQMINQDRKQRAIFVDSSEENKCLETVGQICEKMISMGVNKEYTMYIQGGGMLLDLGGFISSIYMRGLKKVVYIPTTLLAIVDATVGGKNGVNWGGAKNMLGIIRHPHKIKISLHYLESLTDRDFSNGLAQVIKMAITHDAELFELLEDEAITLRRLRTDKQFLRKVIKKSLDIKIKVVENDQFDRNERKWLNFGHTVGHALQLSQAGQDLKHGECVSIGIVQQLKIGEELKCIKDKSIGKRVENVLKKFNLPIKMPSNFNHEQLLRLMAMDKKNQTHNKIQLTLIDEIGHRKASTTSVPIQYLNEYFCNTVRIGAKQIKQGISEVQLKSEIEKANMKWQKQKKFPSSKSLSIRYLFLSALSFKRNQHPIIINNFLQSEDTFHMIECLRALGFGIGFDEQRKQVRIDSYEQKHYGRLNVGNSGLTARFILPFCSHLPGKWLIQCHQRMSERPNKQIFNFCRAHYDCQFEWTNGRQNCFPVKIKTKGLNKESLKNPIELMSQQSSQFISSVLLNSYLWESKRVQLRVPSGRLVSESYIMMTIDCLNNFGASIFMAKGKNESNNHSSIFVSFFPIFIVSQVNIEQDLSSFSYPYALSLIHSAKIYAPLQSVQGDKKFYEYCQSLVGKKLDEVLDFSECTDTFMTMAAILATNTGNRFGIGHQRLQIVGISNQRVKQSNRIRLIKDNLQKIGYLIQEIQDGLIFPIGDLKYRQFQMGETVVFETAGDHRLAMSMAILCTYLNTNQEIVKNKVKFVIDDKTAVRKTFPQFWQYLTDAGIQLNYDTPALYKTNSPSPKLGARSHANRSNLVRTLVMGNRGSGKTAISHMLRSRKQDTAVIDIDQEITKTITEEYSPYKSIAEFVEEKGWEEFRKLQYREIEKYAYSNFLENSNHQQKHVIISLGGGVVDHYQTIKALTKSHKEKVRKIYLEKRLEDLQIELNQKRPVIHNFEEVFRTRSQKYEEICDHIITIPSMGPPNEYTYKKINEYVLNQYQRITQQADSGNTQMEDGFIYCIPRFYGEKGDPIQWVNEPQFKDLSLASQPDNADGSDRVSGVQLRIDALIQEILSTAAQQFTQQQLMRRVRYSIAEHKLFNHSLMKYLPLILTLRTKQQYGLYAGNSLGYQRWVEGLQKIPTSYIDYELKRINEQQIRRNNTNYIYSYHGSQTSTINRLLQLHSEVQKNQTGDLVKLCYDGPGHIWERCQDRWRKHSDICVNLKNPLTRLDNKFKMVVRENDASNMIRIPTRKQLHLLRRVGKYFI